MTQSKSSNVSFDMFCIWSPLFMQIWYELMLKLTNLLCRPNNQFHVHNWNFDKKTQIWNMDAQVEIFMLDHEETCFNRKWYLFHEFCMNMRTQSRVGWLVSWKFDEWKVFKFGRSMLWVKIESEVSEKFSFRTWESFLTLKIGLGMKTCQNWC